MKRPTELKPLSGTFAEMAEALTVPEGVAAEKLNRAIAQRLREAYIEAIRMLAIWKNGEQLVGVMERPLSAVIEEILKYDRPLL
jgi:hypothetical protein